ncbi:Defective in cullin neddylation protein [Plasmodiophora brassicae]|uniref:Uncharacterized protein n=1 Tax=Plasmodiophora brassicae TaxID=37360 RepID=A0A0G4J8Z4_PLABS|nr:hypothetical protein PBRA_003496 [Plasmodiophora brassicae]
MDDDTEVVMKMVADAFARVKGNRPHVTKADLRRQMKDLNSIGSELEGLAASLYNDLSVGKDEDEYIELSDWMDFFKRSNAQSKIKVEDINLMMVVLGFWPIDEQVKTEWAKVYYSVQALDAPTSHHLVKAAEVVLDTENMEEAEEIVEDILYAFIPDYTENRVLTMSEWLGFWARLAIEEPLPSLAQFPAIRRAMQRARPTTQKSLDTVPITHDEI